MPRFVQGVAVGGTPASPSGGEAGRRRWRPFSLRQMGTLVGLAVFALLVREARRAPSFDALGQVESSRADPAGARATDRRLGVEDATSGAASDAAPAADAPPTAVSSAYPLSLIHI